MKNSQRFCEKLLLRNKILDKELLQKRVREVYEQSLELIEREEEDK